MTTLLTFDHLFCLLVEASAKIKVDPSFWSFVVTARFFPLYSRTPGRKWQQEEEKKYIKAECYDIRTR